MAEEQEAHETRTQEWRKNMKHKLGEVRGKYQSGDHLRENVLGVRVKRLPLALAHCRVHNLTKGFCE
jgi:hypothetical protein